RRRGGLGSAVDAGRTGAGAGDRRRSLRPVRAARRRADQAPRGGERAMTRRACRWLLAGVLCCLATPALAKKYRYDGGPAAPADTALSVAVPELETVTRARGPRVPLTNLQLLTLVATAAFEKGLEGMPAERGKEVVIAPAGDHALNYVAEHAILRELARRGLTAAVRHTPVPDDSVVSAMGAGPLLEYQVASARVTYLRLRGWLPGRVKIERQG